MRLYTVCISILMMIVGYSVLSIAPWTGYTSIVCGIAILTYALEHL